MPTDPSNQHPATATLQLPDARPVEPSIAWASLILTPALMPAGLRFRALEADDYDKVLVMCRNSISQVPVTDFDRFSWLLSHSDIHVSLVIENILTSKVVGAGSVFIERKFIHECSAAGHIEDIVICDTERGKGLGKLMIEQLVHVAKQLGVYKVVLDCKQENVAFYQKCYFEPKSVSMALYF